MRNEHLPLIYYFTKRELKQCEHEFLRRLNESLEDAISSSVLNVEKLASKMTVSRSTLNRRLTTLFGLSANEIIKQYKLKKAIELLTAGKNVSETAYLTGFETPSYFIQCFKEVYDVTPKKYVMAISFRT